jgi:hypothetical protein
MYLLNFSRNNQQRKNVKRKDLVAVLSELYKLPIESIESTLDELDQSLKLQGIEDIASQLMTDDLKWKEELVKKIHVICSHLVSQSIGQEFVKIMAESSGLEADFVVDVLNRDAEDGDKGEHNGAKFLVNRTCRKIMAELKSSSN